ncbi:arylsulfatase [Pontiella agarivorans]|uniref:Arylsulfatase n=1 Tax=Pontiella agarivorans TaxID=3038953 RepID=A0ABU5N1X4_9BACT|nr:arylsulfatase [Pontiella agarivorans]MDZ8120251.1 arylsulfatase [Pontiella agarivorans]
MKKFFIRGVFVILLLIASYTAFGKANKRAEGRPNIVLIMVDDMGYSDIGCYGGEIETPNLDRLAANGIRYSEFYNTSKCNTSRESLLMGRYVNRVSEHKNFSSGPTLGELAQQAGYRTLWAGKNHNSIRPPERGFDRFFGIQGGLSNFFCPARKTADGRPVPYTGTSVNEWMVHDEWVELFVPTDPEFYVTDAITDNALLWLKEYSGEDKPFFLYLAYTAPHAPLQAREQDIKKYEGRYDVGYQEIRKQRYKRAVKDGVFNPETAPFHPQKITQWDSLSPEEKELEADRMEVYAAMIDRVDQNVGRVLSELEVRGELDNTLILFMSDNGANGSRGDEYKDYYTPTGNEQLGGMFSWEFLGKNWAMVANSPLGYYKKTSHEGGVCSPMIAYWPEGIPLKNGWVHEPAHLVDIMSTLLDLTDLRYPSEFNGEPAKPNEGISLLPSFRGEPLAVRKHKIGNDYKFGKMIRDGKWKLVQYKELGWELYDMEKDRTETRDLAEQMPEKVAAMKQAFSMWEQNCKAGL